MVKQIEFLLPEYRYGFHLITSQIVSRLGELPETGLVNLFIKHTSAGLTINENAYIIQSGYKRKHSQKSSEKMSLMKFTTLSEVITS